MSTDVSYTPTAFDVREAMSAEHLAHIALEQARGGLAVIEALDAAVDATLELADLIDAVQRGRTAEPGSERRAIADYASWAYGSETSAAQQQRVEAARDHREVPR